MGFKNHVKNNLGEFLCNFKQFPIYLNGVSIFPLVRGRDPEGTAPPLPKWSSRFPYIRSYLSYLSIYLPPIPAFTSSEHHVFLVESYNFPTGLSAWGLSSPHSHRPDGSF